MKAFSKAFCSSMTVYIYVMGGLCGDQTPVLTSLLLLIEGPVYPKMKIQSLSPHLLVSHSSTEAFWLEFLWFAHILSSLPSPKLLFTALKQHKLFHCQSFIQYTVDTVSLLRSRYSHKTWVYSPQHQAQSSASTAG